MLSALQPSAAARACRVLIVDNSAVARLVFKRIVSESGRFTVVAQAASAQDALDKLAQIEVDLILLDIEMPGMTGIEAIPHLRERSGGVPILIVSALCKKNTEASVRAMTMGASDTILKPLSAATKAGFAIELEAAMTRLWDARFDAAEGPAQSPLEILRRPLPSSVRAPVNCLAIGASTGGLHALAKFFDALPREIDMPILVTQHLPAEFVGYFAAQMKIRTGRDVVVAQHGEKLRRGAMLIAPGGANLTVKESGDAAKVHLDVLQPGSRLHGSVDAMLASVAKVYRKSAIGVILSGMGRDGVKGAVDLVGCGGEILVQDKDSAVIWGMPGAAVDRGVATRVASPVELAAQIAERARTFGWG